MPRTTRCRRPIAVLAVSTALFLSSCATDQIAAKPAGQSTQTTTTIQTQTSEPNTATSMATTATEITPTTQAVTTTQAVQGTLDDPLPMGDSQLSGFTFTDYSGDWDGFISGMVETENHRWNEEVGRCVVLLGTLTPTSIEDGTVTTGFSAPSVSLIADGRLVDDEVNSCDTSDIEEAGYGWILDAEVTVGTAYPFYAEFFLPGDPAPEIEVVVLGSASSGDALYYEPTIVDPIPTP